MPRNRSKGLKPITTFGSGEALALTIIGVGTAFTILLFLMLLTLVLGPLSRKLSHKEIVVPAEELNNETRNKALAASLAVSIALTEETTGNVDLEVYTHDASKT